MRASKSGPEVTGSRARVTQVKIGGSRLGGRVAQPHHAGSGLGSHRADSVGQQSPDQVLVGHLRSGRAKRSHPGCPRMTSTSPSIGPRGGDCPAQRGCRSNRGGGRTCALGVQAGAGQMILGRANRGLGWSDMPGNRDRKLCKVRSRTSSVFSPVPQATYARQGPFDAGRRTTAHHCNCGSGRRLQRSGSPYDQQIEGRRQDPQVGAEQSSGVLPDERKCFSRAADRWVINDPEAKDQQVGCRVQSAASGAGTRSGRGPARSSRSPIPYRVVWPRRSGTRAVRGLAA